MTKYLNKYEKKLKKYLQNKDENGGLLNLKYCAYLKIKSDELERDKSYALYKLINTTKAVNLNKVKALVESGANIDSKFEDGVTLYMVAALNCQMDVLDYLNEIGANIKAKTIYGQDALMLVVLMKNNALSGEAKSKYLEVQKKLQSHGFGLTMEVDNVGLTRDDYYLGNTDPFTETYLKLIRKYLTTCNKEDVFIK